MRWFWIDRFTEFVSGERAVAIKNVSLGEPHLHGYFNGYPIMPPSLVLEGMAQTGGMLVGESTSFEARLVLAKVSKVRYHTAPRPGDTLTYTASMSAPVNENGAMFTATSQIGEKLQAEAELFLAILPERHEAEELFNPGEFARLLRLMGVYEVGVNRDGSPLQMPEALLAAERQAATGSGNA